MTPSDGSEFVTDMQRQLHQALIEQPYEVINWGGTAHRRVRRRSASEMLDDGPWGAQDDPRDAMRDAGCDDEVRLQPQPDREPHGRGVDGSARLSGRTDPADVRGDHDADGVAVLRAALRMAPLRTPRFPAPRRSTRTVVGLARRAVQERRRRGRDVVRHLVSVDADLGVLDRTGPRRRRAVQCRGRDVGVDVHLPQEHLEGHRSLLRAHPLASWDRGDPDSRVEEPAG